MKILKIAPGAAPEIMDISDDLSAMQEIVGGLIQALYPFQDSVAVICNDEAKLWGLLPNRALRDPNTGEIYDIICGTMFLCGAPSGSDHFTGLTDEQISYYFEYYKRPECFLKTEDAIIVLKI